MFRPQRLISISMVAGATVVFAFTLKPTANAQNRFEWPEKAENLKQLPVDFPKERLRAVMVGFSKALGVRCSHCHVGEPGAPLTDYDFPSDENPNKNIARDMLAMLGDINEDLDEMDLQGEDRVNMWCHTCHRGRPKPMTLSEELVAAYQGGGIDTALVVYRDLRSRFYGRGAYDFGENTLNELGSGLMGRGRHEEAILIYRLNVEHFPESPHAYESLAQAYTSAGQKDRAIENYEKVLLLDPDNENAAKGLEELRGPGE